MAVPVPFSRAFLLLWLALPGAWLLGRALARRISRDRTTRPVMAAGLALSLAVLSAHVASLLFGSLRIGLPVGLLFVGVAGVLADAVFRTHVAGSATRAASAPSPSAGASHDGAEGRAPSAWMVITMLAATALMAPVAIGYHLHDELYLTGHMSVTAELQNGIYPPRHLAFADTPLRYHYGFDMVSASLTALARLPVDRAIDAATLGLFALAWCLFWALGDRLLGRARAWLAPVCALFAGGFPVACDNHPASLVGRVADMCQVGKHYVNPPVSAYFFQHPWALGIPIGVTAILVVTSRRAPSERVRLATLVAVMGALSISQATLLVAFLPCFVVAEAWREDGFDRRRALRMLLVACASLALAKALGGFFVSVPGLPGLPFVLHAGFGDTWRETARWNAQTFGVLALPAAIGFFTLRRDRLLFALLALGSLVTVNAVRYEGTDDILKLATLATIALAVLSSAALARWLPDRARLRPPISPWKTAAALVVVAATGVSGLVFLVALGGGWQGVPGWMRAHPTTVTAADAEVIAWIRERIRPGDIVYRSAPLTYGYAQWGGLPQPWVQWTAKAFGFPDARIAAREHLTRSAPATPETYRAEGIRFFVLDASRADTAMRAAAEQWIAERKARRVKQIGSLVVIELAP